MPDQHKITATIAQIVREHLDLPPDLGDVAADTLLFKKGLELDSFGVVELIAHLESELSFEFRETDFLEEHFLTIGALGKLIDRYVNRNVAEICS